jgi:hypothetical protein
MTPKEKAEQLVDKMYGVTDYQAKQSALIAVDFALEYVTGDLNEAFDKTLYLLEVKEEINKI